MPDDKRVALHIALSLREQADALIALLAGDDIEPPCRHPNKQDITPAGTAERQWFCPDCGKEWGESNDGA